MRRLVERDRGLDPGNAQATLLTKISDEDKMAFKSASKVELK